MKKLTLYQKWVKAWKAETPAFARLFQTLALGIMALPLYYSNLPVMFQVLSVSVLKYITIAGGISVLLLNFLNKKGDKK